jgi:U32 family peptidase
MDDKGKKIGEITHYYSHINVGIIKLSENVKIGDRLRFRGFTTDFEQEVADMQCNHENVQVGEKGQEVGVKVDHKVRDKDEVFLIE